jgi:cytochrome P450
MATTESPGTTDRPTLDYNPLVPPQSRDRHPVMAQAREQVPVFYSPALHGWVVTRHADICEVVRDHETYSSRGGTKPLVPPCPEAQAILDSGYPFDEVGSVLVTDPPLHTRLRKFIVGVFTPRRVAAMEPRVREIANDLVDGFIDDGSADFVARYSYPLPLVLITELMGLPPEDGKQLHQWSSDKLNIQYTVLPPEGQVDAASGFVELQRYLEGIIEQRRAEPGDDIVSGLLTLRVEDERPLRTHEVIGQLMGILVGGHETTMNMISSSLVLLLRNREQWDALCADPGLAEAAVEESLRVEAPSFGTWRTTTREAQLGGATIPAGERVHIVWGSANHDPAEFPDQPERFDIRAPRTGVNMAFGRGLHFCPGAVLGRLEGRVALEVLTSRIPSLRLDPAIELEYRSSATQHGPVALPLSWDTA